MTDEVASTSAQWDREADVVVLGSGGAAMTAAITAHDFGAKDVVILEKTGMVGGTTAMSGGMLWIPNNHHQLAEGGTDSDEEIVAYLDSLTPDDLDPDNLWAFMQNGPEMLRYFAERTPVRLRAFTDFPIISPIPRARNPMADVRSTTRHSASKSLANGHRGSIPARWPIPCGAA